MIDFCGIELAHPIVNGSGTFDAIAARRTFGDTLLADFPFAAFVSKTVTLEPRQGNPPPRLWEQPAGLINSIGLPNRGLEGYLEHDLPELAALPVPLIVNVMGFTRQEVARLVEAFAVRDEVAALELNVSCPNVESGLIMGADPDETAALLEHVRPLTVQAADRQAHAQRDGRRRRSRPPPRTRAPTRSRSSTRCAAWRWTLARARPGSAAGRAACPVRRCARSPSRR